MMKAFFSYQKNKLRAGTLTQGTKNINSAGNFPFICPIIFS